MAQWPNNGFWIGWLDSLTSSVTVSPNHNQLQELTIFSRTLLPWLPRTRTIPFAFYDWLLIYDWTTYRVSKRIHRRHILYPAMDTCELHRKYLFLYFCIYSALHRNGSYPIVACISVVSYCCRLYLAMGCLARICLRGNVFTESLPSNGSTCHTIMYVYMCVPSVGIFCYYKKVNFWLALLILLSFLKDSRSFLAIILVY
jgi:hypothetical protein